MLGFFLFSMNYLPSGKGFVDFQAESIFQKHIHANYFLAHIFICYSFKFHKEVNGKMLEGAFDH